MIHPYSQESLKLTSPCRACGYGHGLKIIRFKEDAGFVRCGRCDAPQYSLIKKFIGVEDV